MFERAERRPDRQAWRHGLVAWRRRSIVFTASFLFFQKVFRETQSALPLVGHDMVTARATSRAARWHTPTNKAAQRHHHRAPDYKKRRLEKGSIDAACFDPAENKSGACNNGIVHSFPAGDENAVRKQRRSGVADTKNSPPAADRLHKKAPADCSERAIVGRCRGKVDFHIAIFSSFYFLLNTIYCVFLEA